MIVASGFVEVNGLENVQAVIDELRNRGVEVNEIERVRVVFMLEGESIGKVKEELESLKKINDIASVHLAYYSLESEGDGPASNGGSLSSL